MCVCVTTQYEEQLEDCRKYREFLDSITPLEFFEAQAAKLQQRKDNMLAEWQVRTAEREEACSALQSRKQTAIAEESSAP